MDLVTNKFYQNLGKLFYAVAACDKVVRDEEFESLKNVVSNHWLEVDDVKDEFGTDASYQIEIVFDVINSNSDQYDVDEFLHDFQSFKKNNEKLFSSKVERIIWRTCVSITDAFYGRNNAEKEILTKIKKILLD